jgi:hypothetical protein
MNLRPAVEDILATFGPLQKPAISSLVQLTSPGFCFRDDHSRLARIFRHLDHLEIIDGYPRIALGAGLALVTRIRNEKSVTPRTFGYDVAIVHRIVLDSKIGSYFSSQSAEDFELHRLFLDNALKISRTSTSGRFPVVSISRTLVFPKVFKES